MKTKLIVNPASARGKMAARYPHIEQTLRAENFAFDAVFTKRRGHAMELTRAALDAGCDLIVAVGGDGTLHEVVNGMMNADGTARNPYALLGVVSSGTGSDFVRTADIPRDMILAARHLAHADRVFPLDLGETVYRVDGKETRRYFVNVAGMGFDAEVIERLERTGKCCGGTIPYYGTLLATIWNYRNKDAIVRIDDHQGDLSQTIEGRINSVVVCNGRYFGGGMMVGPNAMLDDGKLDVIIIGDLGRLDAVMSTQRLYNGTILEHPKITEYRAQTVAVESKQRILIESDGELIGPGPASFFIHQAALNLRV
jgi:diacylglycerol kinase (ATP)